MSRLIDFRIIMINVNVFLIELNINHIFRLFIVGVLRIFNHFMIMFRTFSDFFYEFFGRRVFFEWYHSFWILSRSHIHAYSLWLWNLYLRSIIINVSSEIVLILLLLNMSIYFWTLLFCYFFGCLLRLKGMNLGMWRIWKSLSAFLNIMLLLSFTLFSLFIFDILRIFENNILMRSNSVGKWVKIPCESPFRTHLLIYIDLMVLLKNFRNILLKSFILLSFN